MFSVANFQDGNDSDEENIAFIRRRIRDASNPLELSNSRFISLYSLSKEAFTYLLNEMSSHFKVCVTSSFIPALLKIAGVLRFFAEGSYQQGTGQDLTIGISQSSFSYCLNEVLNIFEQIMCSQWISFQLSELEKDHKKEYFYRKTAFPGVIGCVDGTHINIIKPVENEHIFFNRKGHHSINTMSVIIKCEFDQLMQELGDSSHDSMIWGSSDQRQYFEEKRRSGDRNSWLLSDSGYPLEPWIITPFRSTVEGSPEANFNKSTLKT